jgi:hypothetical protein
MKAKFELRLFDDRINLCVDPEENTNLNDLIDHIKAYDPEKPKKSAELILDNDETVDAIILNNQDRDNVYILTLNRGGKINISDEFAEAIKAKLMPKKTETPLDVFNEFTDDWKVKVNCKQATTKTTTDSEFADAITEWLADLSSEKISYKTFKSNIKNLLYFTEALQDRPCKPKLEADIEAKYKDKLDRISLLWKDVRIDPCDDILIGIRYNTEKIIKE